MVVVLGMNIVSSATPVLSRGDVQLNLCFQQIYTRPEVVSSVISAVDHMRERRREYLTIS